MVTGMLWINLERDHLLRTINRTQEDGLATQCSQCQSTVLRELEGGSCGRLDTLLPTVVRDRLL